MRGSRICCLKRIRRWRIHDRELPSMALLTRLANRATVRAGLTIQTTIVLWHGGHHAATVIHVCLHHGLFHGARLRQLHRCHPLQGDAKQK